MEIIMIMMIHMVKGEQFQPDIYQLMTMKMIWQDTEPAQGLTICQDILDLRITPTSPSMDQTRVSTEPPSETVSLNMKRPLPQLQTWPEMLMARVRMTSTELPVTLTTAMLLLMESTGLQTVTVRVLELMSLV